MSEFQVRSTIIALVVLAIGFVMSLVATGLPEWTKDFDMTGEPRRRFFKYGLFQKCETPFIEIEEKWGDTTCIMYETRDIEPGEGDYVMAARSMIIIGAIFALAGVVLSGIYMKVRLSLLGFLVLAASIASGVFMLITLGIWVQKWSALFLRYQDRRAYFGVSVYLTVGAAIACGVAAVLYGAVLLMKCRQDKSLSNKSASLPMNPRS